MAQKKSAGLKAPVPGLISEEFRWFSGLTRKSAAIIIAVLSVCFYITSVNNEYALDDGIIMHQNDHVLKGIRGVADILTLDAYESFYRRMCATDQLAGGRYRPLSVVSFALEQELLGTYRTGSYTKVEDSNKNNVLDLNPVSFINGCGRAETNYEFNDFVDSNGDGQPQPGECYACWDRNRNFINDREEDINSDGIFNEVDCQIYGSWFRHFNNIWMYALGCVLLYRLFSVYFFRRWQDLAFLSALIFALHPIHSEAVANVKSRDEIFSLIFISLTFWYSFRYLETRKNRNLSIAGCMFFLALLSKEYAVMLLALLPLSVLSFTVNDIVIKSFIRTPEFRKAAYVAGTFVICAFIMTYVKRDFDIHAFPGQKPVRSFWLFPFVYVLVGIFLTGAGKRNNFGKLMAWFYFVMLLYIGMRWMAVKLKPGVPDTEILNNPYLLATGAERFCTKTFVLLKYLILQLFPHPLSSDYSFNTIEYRNFRSWDFILSLIVHISMVILAVYYTLRKHILGFAIAMYILFALLIGNVLMDIGATMGERLIFHSSIGFCIAVSYLILKGLDNIHRVSYSVRRVVLICCLSVLLALYGIKTWERNFDWRNDITLFIKDTRTNPNSVLCLGNAGARYVDLLGTNDFSSGGPKPGYDSTFNDHNGTLLEIEEGVRSGLYSSRREGAIKLGIRALTHAIDLHPRYVNGYLNLGLLYFHLRKDFEALYYWKNAEKLYPNNPYLRNYYSVYENDLKQRGAVAINRQRWDSAAIAWNLLSILKPYDTENLYNLGGAYFNQGRYLDCKKAWDKLLAIKPDHKEVRKLMPVVNQYVSQQSVPVTN